MPEEQGIIYKVTYQEEDFYCYYPVSRPTLSLQSSILFPYFSCFTFCLTLSFVTPSLFFHRHAFHTLILSTLFVFCFHIPQLIFLTCLVYPPTPPPLPTPTLFLPHTILVSLLYMAYFFLNSFLSRAISVFLLFISPTPFHLCFSTPHSSSSPQPHAISIWLISLKPFVSHTIFGSLLSAPQPPIL